MSSRTSFTAPVFADQTALTAPESINAVRFDDSIGTASAFFLPKHYAIAAQGGGSGSPLNGRWQAGEASNSFQPLAADSIIKIIKKGRGEEGEGK